MIPTRLIQRAFAEGDEKEQLQTACYLYREFLNHHNTESRARKIERQSIEKTMDAFQNFLKRTFIDRDHDDRNLNRFKTLHSIANQARERLEMVLMRPEELTDHP